jgi:actin-related protein 10
MPIYEALSDKLTVVLDIGSAYTKFGFSGEYAPRCIIRSEVCCKKTNTIRRILDYKDEKDLYDLLVDFVHVLYFKYALFSPKDKPIVIVESLLCPTLFRETLAKVLFVHYEISMMLVLPTHLVSLSTLGAETALVLDVGYLEAVAIPICHGFPVIHAWQALSLGAQAIHK